MTGTPVNPLGATRVERTIRLLEEGRGARPT